MIWRRCSSVWAFLALVGLICGANLLSLFYGGGSRVTHLLRPGQDRDLDRGIPNHPGVRNHPDLYWPPWKYLNDKCGKLFISPSLQISTFPSPFTPVCLLTMSSNRRNDVHSSGPFPGACGRKPRSPRYSCVCGIPNRYDHLRCG